MKNMLKTGQTLPLNLEPCHSAGQHPLIALYRRLANWRQRRRDRLILSALSDDQLKDIGLSRSEAGQFSDKN